MKTQWQKIIKLHKEFKKNNRFRHAIDLYTKLHFSKATFHRLIKTMEKELKAPIIHDSRLGYKYNSDKVNSFELPGIWFSEDELHALLLLRDISNSLQDGFFSSFMAPLNEHLDELLKAQDISKKAWCEKIKIISVAYRKLRPSIYKTVIEAILHKKKMAIIYWKYNDQSNDKRIISPQKVLRYKDNWYLDAYCHKDNMLKTFSINRIMESEILNESLKTIPTKEIESLYNSTYGIFSGGEIKTAIIKFRNYAAFEIAQEEWHPKQILKKVENNCIQLEVPYGHSRELIMDILRWGADAEVVSPPELRNEITQIINRSQTIYSE